MDFRKIKFKFDCDLLDNNYIDNIFDGIKSSLNLSFNNIYEFKDVSNQSEDSIEKEINQFFNFTFKNSNEEHYKFLILKNNDKLSILANIYSSILDYNSITYFYQLFNDSNNSREIDILSDQSDIIEYLSSSDFEKDSNYWKNHLLDMGNYVKFHNVKSNNYKIINIPFDNKLLKEFLIQQNTSKHNFLTAIFSLYLSRIDRTKGTLLKTIIPSNSVNTLLKIDFIKDYSFINYLDEINKIYLDAVNHTKVNIENYFDENLSYYSIFDFSNLDKNILVKNGEGSALTLNIYEDYLDLVYNSDLFFDVYMEHMADNINHLINEVIAFPDLILNEVDILSDVDKDLLADFCKGKSIGVDKDNTVAGAFRENAIKYPDFIAVDDGVNQVTYAELEKSSNSVAHDLKYNYGVAFGECVGLMLPRNYHFLELALALNKIGAIFTPIDPNYPLKRIEHMLNISEARYIITTNEYAVDFSFDADVIYIEDLNMDNNVSIECLGSGDDLLAIFFTSGTTGLPKGVMLSNKQINGEAAAFKDIFNSSPGDVVGYFASFSFIASARIFASFIFGECCRIFNEMEQKDSLLLVKTLKEQEMCDLILPPSIGVPIFENEEIKLKYLILAGAKLNELTNTKSNTRLVNFYGATELIFAIANIYDLNNISADSVPIGRPIANTWVYILDEEGKQMPIGVPGEICISNDFLSPGYYNQPELTKMAFVDNPYCTCEDNRRLYRTGDIGFYNFDGEIEILGREDDQLSVRGFRIESNEILNIMNSFDSMGDVYLDVDNDTLTAYYTAEDDLDIGIVKDSLKSELPYYMIPSLFVKLDKIPLNVNGKIDKTVLKSIVQKSIDIEINDETLKIVLDAFREVLSNNSILLDDDFVELGGTSLSAMNLQRILKDELGVSLSSSEIIDLASPVNIANHIKYNLKAHSSLDVSYTFEDKCPLSESQLNVYLDEKVNDMGTAYNNPFKIQFKKKYSFNNVKNAIRELYECYPILKARIIEDENGVSFSFDVEPFVACGLSHDVDDFVKPFDLNKSLAHFLFVEDGSLLCVDFHHLILDGSSLNIIFNTLFDILNGKIVDFIDDGFLRQISFEESILDTDYTENASDFFDEMFVDLDEAYDLLESVKIDNNDGYEYFESFNLEESLLNSFLNNHSITRNHFFCSIFAYTLSRFTGSSKVSFNLIEDGRGHLDLSESVGMFVRTLPILVDCRNQAVDSFLRYCGGLVNRVMFYDLYPFRLLAKDYDLNSNILFQYSHDLFHNLINTEELNCKVVDLKQEVMGDLSFFIFNVGDGKLGIRILYSEKFSKEFIENFVESYKLILKEIMNVNNLSDINYTLSSDLNALNSYNQTQTDLNFNDLLDAFNDNLSKHPHNKLVSYGNTSYSYEESAFIADILARKLVDLGVDLQDCIPFMVERSELYMFCALGILSVGGIYVPLDDSLPDERIKFMMKDSGAGLLIVSDETYERAKNLFNDDIILLNISDIVKEDIKTLSSLPVVYGDLACILYTSGTTGVPKGVKITRKGITSYVDFYVKEYNMKEDSVFGLFASIGFDVGAIRGICAPLYGGSCLDIVPMDIRLNIDKLNEHFINHDVTHTTLPTQVAKMFIDEVEDTSLEVLITGGEKLGEVNTSVDYSFIDSYGPTECCVAVCAIEEKNKIHSSSIGHLFNNIKAYVLDKELRRVPIGAVGELCITGPQVAKGYLNRPKETEEAFVKNPFDTNENYNVMYRTGDLVRLFPDGSFGIIGRRDNQVKIRGNRVELLEVEAIIREIDYVKDVTVQTITHDDNNELVAYVVTDTEINNVNLQKRIQDHVSYHKPDYMVPSFIIDLDNIPLTVNGKVDKYALPEVDRSSLHVEYVAPRNENERIVVEAFEKTFNMEKISIYDDFTRLGGDSLIAIKLSSYLEGHDITLGDILNLRTPIAIADNMDDDISLDLDVYSSDSGCPLNEAQVNLFADIMLSDSIDFYHIPIYMHISKKYPLEKVLDALDEILKVHPILGMHLSNQYERHKKGLFTRINDDIKLLKELGDSYNDKSIMDLLRENEWNIKNIYDMFRIILRLFNGEYPYLLKGPKPPITVENNINKDIIKNFINAPFDIFNNLSMFKVFELEDSYLLLAKFHHIIFDAMSGNVLKRNIQAILDGKVVDIDDSFLKMSAFNQQIKNTEKFIEAADFYNHMFSDIEEVEGLVGDNQSKGYNINTFDLEVDYTALKSFLDETGISENILLTSVFAYTLSRFVSSDNVLFSIVDNGRGRFNDYNSVGLYATVVPLLINCEDQSIESFLNHSSNIVYGATKYNYYPILLISKEYPIDFTVLFQYVPDSIVYDGFNDGDDSIFSSEIIDDIINDLLTSLDDLIAEFIVQLFQKGENYSLMIVNSNNYSDKMIKDFKNTYESILSNIISIDMSSDLSSTLK